MKNKESKKVSQLDRANEALKELKQNVTSEDRKDCGFSEPIIVAYLKGEGRDLATAMTLLRFFRKRINEREKELNGVRA